MESIVTTPNNVEDFFFDRMFSVFMKYGIPTHHFMAEEVDSDDSVHTSSIGFGVLNIAGEFFYKL